MSGRRVALYFSWSRAAEQSAKLGELNDRYPALFELRRAIWPIADGLGAMINQGIGGFLEEIVLNDFAQFRELGRSITGHEVELRQRYSPDCTYLPLGDWIQNFDTLIVVSLDHFITQQVAEPGEVTALREFLSKHDKAAFICLHHDVGTTPDIVAEFAHHGDRLVPSRQRIGGFGRSLLDGLGLGIEHCFGLQPARDPDGRPTPLVKSAEGAVHSLLDGVETFNLHPHLPAFLIATDAQDKLVVLARQKISQAAPPHPGLTPSEQMFNALLASTPQAGVGTVFVCDATLWSSAFGGDESLRRLWRNLFLMQT